MSEDVAKASYNKGIDLENLHRYEEAIAAYSEVVTRFDNSQNTTIQETVAMALYNKGFALENLHRYEEAIAVNNDVITLFGNSQNTIIQEAIAKARQLLEELANVTR